jgi:hypothetical protein
MAWKKLEQMHTKTVTATEGDECHLCEITVGRVHTGKNRVYTDYYCQIICNGMTILKEEKSMYRAMIQATDEIKVNGLFLNINGLHKQYRESGLSENTGWGYLPDQIKAVLMIDEMDKRTLLMNKNDSKMLEEVLSGLTISAIVKVIQVFVQILPDDILDVQIECLGLNWSEYPLTIYMTGKYSNDELDVIRFTYSKDRILRVSGEYSILNPEDGGVSIFNPEAVFIDMETAGFLNEMFD